MALNDVQYTFLRGEGYEGALPDMWQSWLFDQAGTPSNTDENNDLWIILLTDLGYTGALQDMWKAWLADNGFADDNDYWQAVIDGVVPSPGGDTEGLKVGTSAEGTGILFGFGNGQGALEPTDFLDTGTNITKFGVIEGAGDWADNGDWSNNGDWAIATFDKLILGEVLPDVGNIEITINGITTTASFNNGVYESEDANAELIYDLLKMNVGTTYSFDIVENTPQGNLIVSDASPFIGPLGVGYITPSQTGGIAVGSLNPPVIVDGQAIIALYAILNNGEKLVAIGFDDDAPAQILTTFNGVSYTFQGGVLQSDALFDFLSANQDTPIQFTAEAVDPSGSVLVVGDFSSLTSDPSSSAYATPSQSGGAAIGSLNPPILLNGSPLELLYTINVDIGSGPEKYILMGNGADDLEGRVDTVFNGVPYTFDALPGLGTTPTIQSDTLYDFLFNNRGTPIVFTAETVA